MPAVSVQPDATPEAVIPPKEWPWTRLWDTSRTWNTMVQNNVVCEFIDKWWYERTYFSSCVPSFVVEVGTLIAGNHYHLMPTFVTVAVARGFGFANEGHTLFLGIRHKDRSWFGEPQTWRRREDGAMVRDDKFIDRDAMVRKKLRELPWAERAVKAFFVTLHQFWKNTNRIPGYVLGGLGTPVALVLGGVFGVHGLTVGIISYGLLGLTLAPEVRLAGRAAVFTGKHLSLLKTKPGRRIVLRGITEIFDSQRLDDVGDLEQIFDKQRVDEREHLKALLSEQRAPMSSSPEPAGLETAMDVAGRFADGRPRQVLRPTPVGSKPAAARQSAPVESPAVSATPEIATTRANPQQAELG